MKNKREPVKNSSQRKLDKQVYERQVQICKAFANSTRLQILDLVADRPQTSSSLQQRLGISTPNLSQHLAILRAAGVLLTRREGKRIYCSLAIPEVKQACQLIRGVLRAQIRNGRKLVV